MDRLQRHDRLPRLLPRQKHSRPRLLWPRSLAMNVNTPRQGQHMARHINVTFITFSKKTNEKMHLSLVHLSLVHHH